MPSVPLIAASVMSKKLAVGTDLILLDVKAGSGAFMKTPEDAEDLARACLALARGWGRAADVAVTDMSQPLGDAIGNALDVVEAVELLRGTFRGRLRDLAVLFAAKGLEATEGTAPRRGDGTRRATRWTAERRSSASAAWSRRRAAIRTWWTTRAPILPSAPVVMPIEAAGAGTLGGVDAEAIGTASVALGAGRIRKGDPIDPAVGSWSAARSATGSRRGSRSGRSMPGPPTTPPKRRVGCWRRSP